MVGSQQTLDNLSLYFSDKHMVLRSDRMVVGFTGYWHLLASLFALKINADSNSSLQKWAYDLRLTSTYQHS
jgi:hypothetical protein